jgi:hypothetical protein
MYRKIFGNIVIIIDIEIPNIAPPYSGVKSLSLSLSPSSFKIQGKLQQIQGREWKNFFFLSSFIITEKEEGGGGCRDYDSSSHDKRILPG